MIGSLRQVFDGLCGEYLGYTEVSEYLTNLMQEENLTFEQVITMYFSSLNERNFYWLDGLYTSLHDLLFQLKCVRDWLKSYNWENLVLFHPFNKKGWPNDKIYGMLEKQLYILANEATIAELQKQCRN